ncbi:MAG: hypothetical protein A3J74_08440 [Elusimicrobia bacterium RIFCSPHIGHO2_02_FULL_57_9]|nr:MAG: hypothetical protein A3J74_08440 [Elusimicrobia bacterium RIFCSPHIGHO2_02_FULL_57_9]
MGGDGTVGEIVDGYLGAPELLRRRAVLGTVPVGSGCDLARYLGLRCDGESISEMIQRPRIRVLDAGAVDFKGPGGASLRRYFINVAAFGLAGDVARRVSARGKAWGGTLSYLLSSLAALAQAKAKPVDLIVDGVPSPRASYHLVVMANTSTFGGGMRVAPQADPEDGRLDLITVEEMSRWELVRRLPLIYTGRHMRLPGVGRRLVRRLEAKGDEATFLNIDGEALGMLPAIFEVLPKAVSFLSL